MRCIGREAVGHVDHRRGDLREPAALLEPQRRPRKSAAAEGGPRRAEGPGEDDEIAGTRARATRHALRAADRGHAQEDGRRERRVAAAHRHARLAQSLVELDDVLHSR